MKTSRKEALIMTLAVAAIAGSALSIWRTQLSGSDFNAPLHRGVGERTAEETARVLKANGRIVVVTLQPGANAIVDSQLKAFKETLTKWPGLKVVREDKVDVEESAKYGPGAGLSARRFMKLREKWKDAGAIVSLIGAPDPQDLKTASESSGPVLIAVSRSHKKLAPLFENRTLACAIVPRFAFPAPGTEEPRTPSEWFQSRFQVIADKL